MSATKIFMPISIAMAILLSFAAYAQEPHANSSAPPEAGQILAILSPWIKCASEKTKALLQSSDPALCSNGYPDQQRAILLEQEMAAQVSQNCSLDMQAISNLYNNSDQARAFIAGAALTHRLTLMPSIFNWCAK